MANERNESAVSLTNLESQVTDIDRKLTAVVERSDDLAAVLIALLAQHGDPTHVTVERAAELRGCSMKTIRRLIDAGELTLDVIPGTRQSGIPVEQLYAQWIPIRVARQALQKMREQGRTAVRRTASRRTPGAAQTRAVPRNRKTRT